MTYQRERAEVRRLLKDAHRLAAQYEIDETGRSAAGEAKKPGKDDEGPVAKDGHGTSGVDSGSNEALLMLLARMRLILTTIEDDDRSDAERLAELVSNYETAMTEALERINRLR